MKYYNIVEGQHCVFSSKEIEMGNINVVKKR